MMLSGILCHDGTDQSICFKTEMAQPLTNDRLLTVSCAVMPQKHDVLLLMSTSEEPSLNNSLNAWRFSNWPGNVEFHQWIEKFIINNNNKLSTQNLKRKANIPLSLICPSRSIGSSVMQYISNHGGRFLRIANCECARVHMPNSDCYCRFHKWEIADLSAVSLTIESLLNIKEEFLPDNHQEQNEIEILKTTGRKKKKKKGKTTRKLPLNLNQISTRSNASSLNQQNGKSTTTETNIETRLVTKVAIRKSHLIISLRKQSPVTDKKNMKKKKHNDTLEVTESNQQNTRNISNRFKKTATREHSIQIEDFDSTPEGLSMCDLVKLRKRGLSTQDNLPLDIEESRSCLMESFEGYVNKVSASKKRKKRNSKGDNLNSNIGEGDNQFPSTGATKNNKKSKIIIDKKYIPTYTEPIKQDILLVGKGNFSFQSFFTWPGNVYFHKVIENFHLIHNNNPIQAESHVFIQKKNMATSIMDEIFRIGGRFLYGSRKIIMSEQQIVENPLDTMQIERHESHQQLDSSGRISTLSEDLFEWVIIDSQQRIIDIIYKAARMDQNPQKLPPHTTHLVKHNEEVVMDTVITTESALQKCSPLSSIQRLDHLNVEPIESIVSSMTASRIIAGDNPDLEVANTTAIAFNSSQEDLHSQPSTGLAQEISNANNFMMLRDASMELQEAPQRARLSPERLLQLQRELSEVCARIQIYDPTVTCVDIADDFTDEMVATLGQTLYHTVTENENDKQLLHIKAMGLEISGFSHAAIRKDESNNPYRYLFLFLEKSPVLRTVFLNGCDFTSVPVCERFLKSLAKSSAIKYLTVCNVSFTLSSLKSFLCSTSSIEELELEGCTLVPDERTDVLSERDDATIDTKKPSFRNCSLKHIMFKGEDCFRDQFLVPILKLLIFCDNLERISWTHRDDTTNHNFVLDSTDVSKEAWCGLAEVITNCKTLNHLSFSSWTFRGNDIQIISRAIQTRISSKFQVSFAASCRADETATNCIISMFSDLQKSNDATICSNNHGAKIQRGATSLQIGSGCRFSKHVLKLITNILENPDSSLEQLSLRSLTANQLDTLLWKILPAASSVKRLDLGSGCISDARRLRILLHALPYFQHLRELTLHIDVEAENNKKQKDKCFYQTKLELLDALKRNGSLFHVNFLNGDDGNVWNDDGSSSPQPISLWTTEQQTKVEGYLKRNQFLSDHRNAASLPSTFPHVASCALQCEHGSWSIFRGLLTLGDYEKVVVDKNCDNNNSNNHSEKLQSSNTKSVDVINEDVIVTEQCMQTRRNAVTEHCSLNDSRSKRRMKRG